MKGGEEGVQRLMAENEEIAEERVELGMRKTRLEEAKRVLMAFTSRQAGANGQWEETSERAQTTRKQQNSLARCFLVLLSPLASLCEQDRLRGLTASAPLEKREEYTGEFLTAHSPPSTFTATTHRLVKGDLSTDRLEDGRELLRLLLCRTLLEGLGERLDELLGLLEGERMRNGEKGKGKRGKGRERRRRAESRYAKR
jgi:hypothetical protein